MDNQLREFIKSKERLDLKIDYVFKKIFSKPENNLELIEFLEAILHIKIVKIEIKNPELPKDYKDQKLGVLDIRAHINDDTIIDIEMQVSNGRTIINRNLAYSSNIMSGQLQVGEFYKDIKTVISIVILAENVFKRNSYLNEAKLIFTEPDPEYCVDMGYKGEEHILTEKLRYIYIELPKFLEKNPDMSTKLNQWLWLLVGREDMVKMASKENKLIENVVEDLDTMSADENERFEAFKRKVAIWESNMLKQEGLEEGETKGRAEGEAKKQNEIAKKMKDEGAEIEFIVRVTGLTKEEVEAL